MWNKKLFLSSRILQNTVYSMVNNIRACKDGATHGLRQELENLKRDMGPTENMVKNLRFALADTQALNKFHRDGNTDDDHQDILV